MAEFTKILEKIESDEVQAKVIGLRKREFEKAIKLNDERTKRMALENTFGRPILFAFYRESDVLVNFVEFVMKNGVVVIS